MKYQCGVQSYDESIRYFLFVSIRGQRVIVTIWLLFCITSVKYRVLELKAVNRQ